jgi:hypothetical protein
MSVGPRDVVERKRSPEPSAFHVGSTPVTSPEPYWIAPCLPELTPSSDITSMWGGASGESATS